MLYDQWLHTIRISKSSSSRGRRPDGEIIFEEKKKNTKVAEREVLHAQSRSSLVNIVLYIESATSCMKEGTVNSI